MNPMMVRESSPGHPMTRKEVKGQLALQGKGKGGRGKTASVKGKATEAVKKGKSGT